MSKGFNYVFKRNEIKYLISANEYDALREKMEDIIEPDSYGLSTICNVYYDTAADDLIRRSISKPVYKEKFRVRSYGTVTSEDPVFLEIKKKFKSTVYKRRVAVTKAEADRYLTCGSAPHERVQIFDEIDYFLKLYRLTPKVYIAYDRLACIPRGATAEKYPSFRVTFDKNIRTRTNRLDLSEDTDGSIIRMPNNKIYLMEIKTAEAIPLEVVKVLTEMKIYPSSFSKYGTIYTQNIINRERNSHLCLPVC